MKITNKIQDIVDEIKWEMKEERSYANIFLSNINNNANDYILENSKRLMREKIQYIAGLADALRFLGFTATFDITTDSKHENVHFYNGVEIK